MQPLRLVSEYKHVGTWVSSAASPQRDIAHKVTGATTFYLQTVSTVFSKKQYTRELRIRAMQALVESRLLSNAGGWADVTLSQMAKLESVRSRVLRKFLECFQGKKSRLAMKRSGRWQKSRRCLCWSWQGGSSWLHAFPEKHRLLYLHFCSVTDLHGNVTCCWISADCATPCRRSWEHCHPQLLNLKLGSACGKLTQGPSSVCEVNGNRH